MNKKFFIFLLIIAIVGIMSPKIISATREILGYKKEISNIVQTSTQELDNIKQNEMLPPQIKDVLDKILFFI